jgi:hypothetical protein
MKVFTEIRLKPILYFPVHLSPTPCHHISNSLTKTIIIVTFKHSYITSGTLHAVILFSRSHPHFFLSFNANYWAHNPRLTWCRMDKHAYTCGRKSSHFFISCNTCAICTNYSWQLLWKYNVELGWIIWIGPDPNKWEKKYIWVETH